MAKNQLTLFDEIWKPISHFPGYEISNHGRIRSFWKLDGRRGWKISNRYKYLPKIHIDKGGYQFVRLRQKHLTIHGLVLTAFVGPRPLDKECRHLDGNQKNNYLNNLKWGTKRENGLDKAMHGNLPPSFCGQGEKHRCAKMTDAKIVEMRNLHASGYSINKLCKMYGIAHSSARAIIHRKTWKHLP